MAEIDTSIYRPQPQQNPFDLITKIGGAADALGNIEAGKAVQGAMGADGEIDQNRLAGLLRQTTVGSMKAIPTLDALAKLRQAGFSADQSGLETFQKRMAITHHLFSGIASRDKPTIDDVYDIAAKALDPALDAKKYGITMPVIMNALKQFRGPDGKPLPPEQIRQKALEIQTQAAHTSEILQQHSPGYQIIDQGGQLTIVPTGTNANPAMGTAVPKTLPPGTPVAGAGGTQYLGAQPPVPGGGVVSPKGGIPGGPSANLGGNVIVQGPSIIAPPVAAGPAAGLPLGSEKSAEVLQGDLARARNFGQEIVPWQQALEKLKLLGPGGTGPGTQGRQEFQSFLFALAPTVSRWAGVDPEKIKNYAEAEKYLTQATQSRAAGFGAHTDLALSQAITGNPSVKINDLAATDVTKVAIALRRMEQVQTLQNAAHGPVDYTKKAAEWATKQDARAYAIDLMPPEQLKKLQKDLKGAERAKFNASLKAAIESGVVAPPGAP